MYTIGYISLNGELSEKYKEFLHMFQCDIQLIEKETIDQFLQGNAEPIKRLDTLIIEDIDFSSINWICGLIMEIRRQTDLPLWILTSVNESNKTNRIVYLQLGADGIIDYNKDLDESILTVKNLIKRFKEPQTQISTPKNSLIRGVKDFQLNPQNLSVCLEDGKEVNLTKLEFLTIEYLHKHARKTMTYEEIYQNVWNDTYGNRKYRVSNLVFHLRKKIEHDIEKPQYIKTIRSKGYMLYI
ncbi:response regulator transcription factor [Enterococcus wangshanyuanii]|uniref:OmpR/PhoB-type domain-containing protein n=1 Tax=Enterococcus wangshanyuanii TaxID=2005703 RepID=A0ABQ1NMW6_9ENTE|nr:winged helix-turn-helix domain-containing protein [Enterococcus wangshanyuanii]GGC78283.1 hypothetical protein GCM10011573_04950 [Enterococcus wangshanyuanii]